ncbi:MAG: carboxypeptidase regulatory-like domain-containing protein [Agromyces sp.]
MIGFTPSAQAAEPRIWTATVLLGSGGAPAAPGEVLVEVIPSGATIPTASAVTGDAGRVTMTLEPSVAYSVRYTYSGSALFDPRPQGAGIYQADQILAVPRLTTISGTVYLGSAARTAGAGDVRVTVSGGGSPDGPMLTAADGSYSVRVSEFRSVGVAFSYIGDESWSDKRLQQIDVQQNPVTGTDVTLDSGSIVSGIVRSSAGVPLSGAKVTLDSSAPLADGTWPEYTATTSADGGYRFAEIAPTSYELVFEANGYASTRWPGYWQSSQSLDLTQPHRYTDKDVTLVRPGSISGHIDFDPNQRSWDDVYSAELQTRNPLTGTWTSYAIDTDVSDNYEFKQLAPSEYRVRGIYRGIYGVASELSPTIVVTEGSTQTWNSPRLRTGTGLTSGTLVKGSGPEIYLVDGPHDLVPIATFDSAVDLGVSTGFQTVPDSTLASYDKESSPLSNAVKCPTGSYLASGGSLHYASEHLLPNVRWTELDEGACSRLTISSAPFGGYLAGKGAVWRVSEWAVKHAVLGGPVPAAMAVNSWFLDQMQTGAPRVIGLVKFADRPAVYLSGGYENLIPISSFESVADLGLSTGFVTRPAAERAGYEIEDSPLGNAVRWDQTVHVGSGGLLRPISSRLAESLPVTVVPDTIWAAMPKHPTRIAAALLMKSPTDPMVYNVFAGTKEPVSSWDEAARLSGSEPVTILTVRSTFLDRLPMVAERLTPGTLVKTATDARVFLVDGDNGLIRIPSFAAVAALGLPTNYRVVSDAAVSARAIAPAPLGSLVDCDGERYLASDGSARPIAEETVTGLARTSLAPATCGAVRFGGALGQGVVVKAPDDSRIWVLTDGGLRPVTSMASFANLQAWYGELRSVDRAFLSGIPVRTAIFAPKTLVKAADGPEVYLVDGRTRLIRIASFDFARDIGASTTFETTARSDLAGYTIASDAASNVASCSLGGLNFIGGGGLQPVVSSAVAGLPAMSLDSETCRGVGSHDPRTTPIFVKSYSDSAVYMIADGAKRPVERFETVVEVSSPHSASVWTVSDEFLSSLRLGSIVYPTGSLVKAVGDPRVSIVDGPDSLVPISSFGAVAEFGWPTSYREVPAAALAAYGVASTTPLDVVVDCQYRMRIGSGGRGWTTPWSSVTGLAVTKLSPFLCDRMPMSMEALTDPALIKSSSSPVIYALDHGVKRAVMSMAALAGIGDGRQIWVTLRPSFVESIPTGTPIS